MGGIQQCSKDELREQLMDEARTPQPHRGSGNAVRIDGWLHSGPLDVDLLLQLVCEVRRACADVYVWQNPAWYLSVVPFWHCIAYLLSSLAVPMLFHGFLACCG